MREGEVMRCIFAFGVIAVMAGVGLAEGPKTGEMKLTFTERSPLSEVKALTKRLKVVAPKGGELEDYDLGKESFLAYVPEKYDAGKPMGLIVLANYKHSDTLPEAVLPQLAEANVALVTPNEFIPVWWQRAGLDLDAAYNMQKMYAIDRHRVYVFGGGDWPDAADNQTHPVGERLAMFYPEVFTGAF